MSSFVMSDEYPMLCNAVYNIGYDIVPSDKILQFHKPEQRHIDMQMLKINNDIFLLKECTELRKKLDNRGYSIIFCKNNITKYYPSFVALNCLYIGGKLYGREDAIDNSVKKYCSNNNIEIVNVNQGYTRCSTAVIGKNAAITADTTIYEALKNNDIDVLKIDSGNIKLEGYNYGFIGGACTILDDNTLIFFGDAKTHPNYPVIEKFCIIHNVKILNLIENSPLIDIGGAIKI
ncbi:DUF6873 family GME fold protein [Ruminococcus sp.]|uniref:DUF6873 family GME fold protein n=1 Tax=Ruminococcus sp. TaxID=41978 RepID=UPI003865EA46